MPIFFQKFIHRRDLRANPDVLYVFGDNHARKGNRGQAAQMRGEPNAVGVATKWRPSLNKGAYFSDADFNLVRDIMIEDLRPVNNHLLERKFVIWPEDGIGTGLSELPQRAPKINSFLMTILDHLKEMQIDA